MSRQMEECRRWIQRDRQGLISEDLKTNGKDYSKGNGKPLEACD